MPNATYVPSRIGEGHFTDFQPPAAGVTDNGKVWAWNSTTSKFEPVTVSGGGTPGGSVTHVQTNDGAGGFAGDSGFTYAGAGVAALTGRLIVPVIRPASDSTAAVKIQNAAGSSDVVVVDTTNKRIGINTTPAEQFQIASSNGAIIKMSSSVNNTGTHSILFAHSFQPEHGATCGIFAVPTGAWGRGYIVFAVKDGSPVTATDAVLTITSTLVSTQKPFQVSSATASNASIIVGPGQSINAGTHSVIFRFGGIADKCGLLAESNGSFGDAKRVGIALNKSANVTASDLKLIVDSNGYIGVNVIDNLTSNLDIAASTTIRSSVRIRSGVAPASPNDGDIWQDGTNIYIRIGGATRTFNLT